MQPHFRMLGVRPFDLPTPDDASPPRSASRGFQEDRSRVRSRDRRQGTAAEVRQVTQALIDSGSCSATSSKHSSRLGPAEGRAVKHRVALLVLVAARCSPGALFAKPSASVSQRLERQHEARPSHLCRAVEAAERRASPGHGARHVVPRNPYHAEHQSHIARPHSHAA